MVNDDTAVGLGIPYFILIVITWFTVGSRSFSYPYTPWLSQISGGILILFGSLFLIPVFILTIIFLATGEDSCEKVAFGLALPGFVLLIIGDITALYFTIDNFVTPSLLLAFTLPQVILAFGLFARRNYSLGNRRGASPMARRARAYRTTSRLPPRRVPSQTPRGRIVISNEVRLASTHGQSIKRCVRCRQTLDTQTKVCYFCGARQPSQAPPRQSRPAPPPAPVSSVYDRVQAPSASQPARFCPNCGAPIARGHMFCTQCGSSLE